MIDVDQQIMEERDVAHWSDWLVLSWGMQKDEGVTVVFMF